MTDPEQIYAWLRLDDRITTSGQPSEAQLAALPPLGITHVINLGLHSHERALPDEAASVARLGMTYVHIPVDFDAPTEADYAHFCAAMAAVGAARVHVHCIVNARVSALLYRFRRDVLAVDEAEARAAMTEIWQPGGVWAAFIGDDDRIALPHAPGRRATARKP
jgi:protein tyrosine phosphatase (PTP) superfamily phosphohydrolase (DUF442 family)